MKTIMKKLGKIALAVLCFLSYFSAVLWAMAYYRGGSSYLYHNSEVEKPLGVFSAIAILLFVALIVFVVFFFRVKKKLVKIIHTVLAVVIICMMSYVSMGFFLANVVLGPNGYSYTEDIANYGNYDRGFYTDHFPAEITEDMTVVDFVYFYKYADVDQIDIYLEVKFDDADIMEQYLTTAIDAFSETGTISYPNPYDGKYTDVIRNRSVIWSPEGNFAAEILFEENNSYRYVDMHYTSVSYSYEELTIIYNYTYLGSDIEVGDDLDQAQYYPRFLQRFGVEWDPDKSFRYRIEE